jgi:hypothetical protein
MSITLVIPKPIATPTRVDAVNWDTALPWMSARLFYFANLRLILALEAELSMKQMFFPTLAKEAIIKKCCGYASAVSSIHNAMLSAKIDMKRNFLISESKFLPYLEAKTIAPSCPRPSLSTH